MLDEFIRSDRRDNDDNVDDNVDIDEDRGSDILLLLLDGSS